MGAYDRMEECSRKKGIIPKEGEIWEHFSGIQVVIVALAISKIEYSQGADIVVYRSLFDGVVAARTLENFLETVYKSKSWHSRYRKVGD